MSRMLLCLFCCSLGFVHAQDPSVQDSLPKLSLRKMVRPYPMAKKAFRQYRVKTIGGTVVGTSGVLLLNHSLGSISQNNPHQWELTAGGIGLIGVGLWITKGAKAKRKKAVALIPKKKVGDLQFTFSPTGLVLRF